MESKKATAKPARWAPGRAAAFGDQSVVDRYHLRPPYPCHTFMHGAGRYGLQCLTNLDQLPPTGALVVAAPLKIRQGSGSPLRVLAFVETK